MRKLFVGVVLAAVFGLLVATPVAEARCGGCGGKTKVRHEHKVKHKHKSTSCGSSCGTTCLAAAAPSLACGGCGAPTCASCVGRSVIKTKTVYRGPAGYEVVPAPKPDSKPVAPTPVGAAPPK